jgi:UrcA family protein
MRSATAEPPLRTKKPQIKGGSRCPRAEARPQAKEYPMYRIILFASLTLSVAAPAAGQSYDNPLVQRRTVTSRDLDLSSPAGREALDRRVRAAARAVCRFPVPNGLIPFLYSKRCITGAVRDAAPQVAVAIEFARRNRLRDGAIRVAAQ